MAKKLTYKQYVRKITKQFYKIMDIWAKQHNGHGFFIRHIDGNRANNAIYNIAYLHASDVFAHINDGWVVDWECDLTPKQIELVKEHADFLNSFLNEANADFGKSPLKGKASIMNPHMERELVPIEEADKYKDFWAQHCITK